MKRRLWPRTKALRGGALIACAALAVGTGLRLGSARTPARPPVLSQPGALTGNGRASAQPVARPSRSVRVFRPAPPDPVLPVKDAYNHGRYLDAEARAQQVIKRMGHSKDVRQRTEAAQARSVMAYAAARRRDLTLARMRFALLEKDAATLPDGGRLKARTMEPQASLAEDAAYQHAVCTAALGNKSGAEAEYVAFMKRFPESPLVAGAVTRIARLHGGKVPAAAQATWQQAEKTAMQRQEQRQAKASVCGPECLAELLRRRGEKADVATLALEMGTNGRGTSLASMAGAAQAHGFHPQGLELTQKGLAEQRLPVVALLRPGHYVLVEALSPQGVTVWDPDARGVGQSAKRDVPFALWARAWSGAALALEPVGAIQTAQR